jgi:hypothetical protein
MLFFRFWLSRSAGRYCHAGCKSSAARCGTFAVGFSSMPGGPAWADIHDRSPLSSEDDH